MNFNTNVKVSPEMAHFVSRAPAWLRNRAAVAAAASVASVAPDRRINPNPSWVPKIPQHVPIPVGAAVRKSALEIGRRYIFADHRFLMYGTSPVYYNGTVIGTFMGYETSRDLENQTEHNGVREFDTYYVETFANFKLENIQLTQPTGDYVSMSRFGINAPETGAGIFPNGYSVDVYLLPTPEKEHAHELAADASNETLCLSV